MVVDRELVIPEIIFRGILILIVIKTLAVVVVADFNILIPFTFTVICMIVIGNIVTCCRTIDML